MSDYCTLEELKADLRLADDADDEALSVAISAASRQIDSYCDVRPGGFAPSQTASARVFTPISAVVCPIDDLGTVTDLAVAVDRTGTGTFGAALTANQDFVLYPLNATAYGQPFNELRMVHPSCQAGRSRVEVTGRWGWLAVPDEVGKATRLQALQLFKGTDAPFGVAGSAEFGVLRLRERLHPLAAGLLAGFRKPAIA